jgi:hypothetical protein
MPQGSDSLHRGLTRKLPDRPFGRDGDPADFGFTESLHVGEPDAGAWVRDVAARSDVHSVTGVPAVVPIEVRERFPSHNQVQLNSQWRVRKAATHERTAATPETPRP